MNPSPPIEASERPERIAVIGGGLGGLSAAIHLRLAGFSVTLYEANERVGGRANIIEQDGFRFDTGPSLLNYPWVFEELFAAAGRDLHEYVDLLPVDPSVRFAWPDGQTFDLSSNLARLREECERMEPGCTPGLTAFLADAEVKYRFSFEKLIRQNVDNPVAWMGALTPREMLRSAVWRSLYGELGRFFRSARLKEALGSYAMYLGGSPWQLPGLFSILPYGELAYGLWLPSGGVYALVEAVERLAAGLGVRIVKGRRVRRILVPDRQVAGLEFEDGTRTNELLVVSNVDVPTTQAELLDPGKVRKRRIAMTPGVVTFYWGIRGQVDGLRHHTIFLPDDFRETFRDLLERKRIPRKPAFYISIPSGTDPSLAPAGHTAAFALVPTPKLSDTGSIDWNAAVRDIREQIFSRLRRHGVRLDPDRIVFEQVWTPGTWKQAFGLYDGSAFGASHTLFQLGPMRSRNYDRRIKGLYYAGAGTTPGTGLPMVVLGGEMTARRILSHVR